jgi:hypothetical protein
LTPPDESPLPPAELQPAPGWRVATALLLALVLLQIGRSALSYCPAEIAGDGLVYLKDAHTLRHGYLADNLAALRHGPGEAGRDHRRLVTEGGYATVLALAQRWHPRLPYLLNGLALPLLLLAAVWLLHKLSTTRHGGWMAASLFLLLALSCDGPLALWKMTDLLRDPLAHLLGMLGLAMTLPARGADSPRRGSVVCGGLLIGLATWTRIPDILFAGPALLGTLWPHGRLQRSTWRRASALLLGMGLGLLPLAGQNLLEGKSLRESGQASLILPGSASAPADARETGAKRLHVSNLATNFKTTGLALSRSLPFWLWICCCASLAAGLVARGQRGRTVLLGCGMLVFFLLYSCYCHFVPRYFFVTVLFLLSLVASIGAAGIEWLLERVHSRRQRDLFALALPLFALAWVTVMAARQQNPAAAERDARWQDALRFQSWAAGLIGPDDTVFSNHQGTRAWLLTLSSLADATMNWRWTAVQSNAAAAAQALLLDQRRVFYLATTDEHGEEYDSWWKEDMLNYFDLEQAGPSLQVAGQQRTRLLYELKQPGTRRREVQLEPDPGSARFLYLLARQLPDGRRWQAVRITGDPGMPALNARLQSGPNLLELPPGFIRAGIVTLESDEGPLPSASRIHAVGPRLASLHFRDYATWPIHLPLLEGAQLRWSGFPIWQRDWGAFRRQGHVSRPRFLIDRQASLRLPSCTDDLLVRLFLSHRDGTTPRDPARAVLCRISGEVPRVGGVTFGGRKSYWLQQVLVPARLLETERNPALELTWPGGDDEDALPELMRVDFLPVPEVKFPPEASPQQAWVLPREEADPPGALEDPTYRLLTHAADITLPDPPAGPLLLRFTVHTPPDADRPQRIHARIDDGEAFMVESPPGAAVVILPVTSHVGQRALRMVASSAIEPSGTTTPCSLGDLTLIAAPASGPPPFTPSSNDPLWPLTAGLWKPEFYTDGTPFCWTRAEASIALPVRHLPPSGRLLLDLGGPPRGAGPRPARVLLNGVLLDTITVRESGRDTHEVPVPAEQWREGLNTLVLACETWQPSAVLQSDDSRELGIRIFGFSFALADAPTLTPTRHPSP